MPTGYTAAIEDGITFEQFVLRCARAFGACYSMRDDAKDIEIPVFEPSDYYIEELEKAKKWLDELKAITPEIATKMAQKELDENIVSNNKFIKERKKLKSLYLEMLENIKAWEPPTPEHVELKRFMEGQIKRSIRVDCRIVCHEKEKFALKKGADWLNEKTKQAIDKINDWQEEVEKEIKSCEWRNLWVRQLKESLKSEAKL